MRSFSPLTRALRMFALSVFMLNVLAVPALAIGTDTDLDHIYDEDETLYGFDLNNPDENGNGVIDGEDDYEGDGLITQSELYLYGTDPTNLDTDSDGRGDYNEIFVAPTSDPLDVDSDDDGLGDYAEFMTYGTDPELTDTDVDGLGDYYEEITLTNAGFSVSGNDFDSDDDGTSDGGEDFDADGLTNNQEQNTYDTDPIVADTDGDGFSDGTEVLNGTDPLAFEAADLDITDISMDPTTGMISYTAVNLGNLDVDYTIDMGYTGVYLNYGETDETLYYYDWNTEMGAGSWVGTFFTAGGSETIDSGVGLISGEHSVMVCIDRAAMHGEFASGLDNCEIETFQVGPDLTVTDVSIVETTTPGQFYIYTDLANLGGIDVDATTPGAITSTLNGVSEQVYNWSSIDPIYQTFLPANGTLLDFESFGARPSLVEGDVIEVCVDTSDLVNELDESNNCLSVTYTDAAEPDLVIDSVTLNSDTSVSFVVRNGGTDSVDSSLFPYLNFYFDFYNSDLSTSDSDSYLIDDHGTDYRSIDGITTVNSGAAAEAFPTCTLYVLAVADGTGEVTELDDLNNEYRTTLDLCADTLTVEAGPDEGVGLGTSYTLPGAYVAGATSLTSATVNWGDGTAAETATQTVVGDLIYLTATHTYSAPETYTVTVCANDGIEEACDTAHISVVGNSSSDSSSSSSSGSSSSGSSSSGSSSSGSSSSGSSSSGSSDDDSSSDEDVDLTEEEDQDVTLSEDEDVSDCSAMLFEDVSEEDSFYTAVCELWAEDILHGKTANFFDSEDVIRRDEASKIFTRWFGYVTETYGETPEATEGLYMDVEATDPLAYYVEVADEQRIVRADVDTFEDEDGEVVSEAYFMPHDALTAQEIADALEVILGDNEAGEELNEEGYESDDTMTRGSFVEFLYGLSR